MRHLLAPRALGLGLILAQAASSQSNQISVSSSVSGAFALHRITVAKAMDNGFTSQFQTALGPANAQQLNQVAPYCLLVANNSDLAIVNIVTRTIMTNSEGRVAYGNNAFDLVRGGLKKGETLAVTPRTQVSQALFYAKRGGTYVGPSMKQLSDEFIVQMHNWRVKSIVVSLDSVTLENGAVIGPDTYGVIARETAMIRARTEVVAKLNDTSLSDDDLTEWLKSNTSRYFGDYYAADGFVDHFGALLKAISVDVLQRMKVNGREKTRTQVLAPTSQYGTLFRAD
jgi:hypothetical protein